MDKQFDSKGGEQNNFFYRLLGRIFTTGNQSPAIGAGRDVQAIEQLEDAAKQQRISAADTNVSQAIAQRIQLRYAKAAAYWQKAAALLPEDKKQERSLCLHEAGYDLDRVSRHSEALPLYEQSLAINREIGDKKQEGVTLNNISQIYYARGDYTTALTYLEQSLVIRREIGDKRGEGTTLNSISQIYDARGDYTTALKHLEQALTIQQEIGDKAGEAVTNSNFADTYKSPILGYAFKDPSDLAKAKAYMSRAVQLAEEIDHPKLKEWRETLEDICYKLQPQSM